MTTIKFLLTAIAVLTIIAVCSIGAVLGIFAISPVYIFAISMTVGCLGLYAYHAAALLHLRIRFNKITKT